MIDENAALVAGGYRGAPTLTYEPDPPVATRATDDKRLVSKLPLRSSEPDWSDIVDDYMVEWGRDPAALADDDFIPPSDEVLREACRIAYILRSYGAAPPTRAVLDGDGGLAFERCCEKRFESISVYPDGTIETAIFLDGNLVERSVVPFGGP